MKSYGFANFVGQHLVPYEYTGISLVVIEASKWLLQRGILLYDSGVVDIHEDIHVYRAI